MDLTDEQAHGKACLLCGGVTSPLVEVGLIESTGARAVVCPETDGVGDAVTDEILFAALVARCEACGEVDETVPTAAPGTERLCAACVRASAAAQQHDPAG